MTLNAKVEAAEFGCKQVKTTVQWRRC